MSRGVPAGWVLVPCAFCGGTDLSVQTYDVQPDDYHGGYVTCTDCDAQGADAISLNGWLHNPDDARAAAITAWNARATPTPPIEGRDADVERVTPLDVLMDKRLIAEAAARAMNPDRDLSLNPLYVGDPAWRIATAVQEDARAAIQALGERG